MRWVEGSLAPFTEHWVPSCEALRPTHQVYISLNRERLTLVSRKYVSALGTVDFCSSRFSVVHSEALLASRSGIYFGRDSYFISLYVTDLPYRTVPYGTLPYRTVRRPLHERISIFFIGGFVISALFRL